jgi:hypothetical protein
MDKEIHDHKRTEAVKNGKAFGWNYFYIIHRSDSQWSQWTEKLFSPPTSWLCFIEFGQKTIDGRIGDTGVSLKLQVGKNRWHRVRVLGAYGGRMLLHSNALSSIQFLTQWSERIFVYFVKVTL